MALDYIVKDIALAGYGRKELDIAENGNAGLDGAARGIRRVKAVEGCADCGLAPYDDPDGGFD